MGQNMKWEKYKREKLSSKKDLKIRWTTLKNEQIKGFVKKINERVNWYINDKINKVWKKVTGTIKIIVEEVLEKNRGRVIDKDTWWWNKEMQKVISRKKKKFNEWQRNKNVEVYGCVFCVFSVLAYLEAKRGVKRVVSS